MKIFTSLIISIIITSFSLPAQTLVKENKLWSNTWIGTDFGWPYGERYESYFIKFKGDTVINDKLYKKILRSDNKDQSGWYVFGAIREDSTQKVFTYNTNYHPGEVLLYDFGLERGDSVQIGTWTAHVTEAKKIKIENFDDSLKLIEIDGFNVWLEGIGSISNDVGGILVGLPEYYMVGQYRDIVCYYENDTLKFSNPKFESCFPDYIVHGIKEYENNSVKIIYRNNQIIFDFKQAIASRSILKIYNIAGEVIYEEQLMQCDKHILSTGNYTPGCYIYSIQSNQKPIYGKLIIGY